MKMLEYIVLLAASAVFSYWFFLRPRPSVLPAAAEEPRREAVLTVEPGLYPLPPETHPQAHGAPEEVRPPSETGAPEGAENEHARNHAPGSPQETDEPTKTPSATDSREPVEKTNTLRQEIEEIAASEDLVRRAQEEVTGRVAQGFETVFRTSAKDQLEIARFFGEPIVLVPRSGLAPGRHLYHRLDPGPPARVVTVREAPPLDRYRQYRDLFTFSYEALPWSIRDLRRRVFVRGDVYLFAALIPPREWALVMTRRDAALAMHNRARTGRPRTLEEVRRFTMRYVRLPGGAFDIRVVDILFADGTDWKPVDGS